MWYTLREGESEGEEENERKRKREKKEKHGAFDFFIDTDYDATIKWN